MKNKEIFNLYEGLHEISQDKELKFNVRISYTFAKDKNIIIIKKYIHYKYLLYSYTPKYFIASSNVGKLL